MIRTSSLLLVAVGLGVWGCGKEEVRSEPPLRPVRTEQVFSTGGARVRTFSGVAEAGTESRLSFKVGGTVRSVPVKVGDKIAAGTLLAELDSGDFQLRVQEAEASLSRGEAEARNAKADYERVRALYESRNASRNDLDAARAGFESAEAQVASTQKKLELARLQLSYTRLTAPVAGAISQVDVEVNENVATGQTVVVLTAGSDIEVMVSVPSAIINFVRRGDTAAIKFDALPGREFTATVTEVGITTTTAATTYPVTISVSGNTGEIRPGMAASVSFRFSGEGNRDRILVPPAAVGQDREGRFVFLVDPVEEGVGVARRTEVRVGDLTDDGLEILEGLSDGDLLVTAGVTKLSDGRRVKLPATQN